MCGVVAVVIAVLIGCLAQFDVHVNEIQHVIVLIMIITVPKPTQQHYVQSLAILNSGSNLNCLIDHLDLLLRHNP